MKRGTGVENAERTMNETKTYRGRSLEEILPRIKAELGPEALITRQRDGLTGGVGGFFQRQCVEVDARPAPRRFDAFDEADAAPEAEEFVEQPLASEDPYTREGLDSPAIRAMIEQAAPFADHLELAESHGHADSQAGAEEPLAQEAYGSATAQGAYGRAAGHGRQRAPVGPPSPPPDVRPVGAAREAPPAAAALRDVLVTEGIDPAVADALIAETVSHLLPFGSPRSLKRLARRALARRIPVDPGVAPAGARSPSLDPVARARPFARPGSPPRTRAAATSPSSA